MRSERGSERRRPARSRRSPTRRAPRRPAARSRGRAPSRGRSGPPVRDRSGRRRGRGPRDRSRGRGPGPAARRPAARRRRVRRSGLHLTAFSSRFATARSSLLGTPSIVVGSRLVLKPMPLALRLVRSMRRRDHLLQCTGSGCTCSVRERSSRSPSSSVSSSAWQRISARIRARSSSGSDVPPLQDLDVRPQARERRAKLVRGVCDQLRLRA